MYDDIHSSKLVEIGQTFQGGGDGGPSQEKKKNLRCAYMPSSLFTELEQLPCFRQLHLYFYFDSNLISYDRSSNNKTVNKRELYLSYHKFDKFDIDSP